MYNLIRRLSSSFLPRPDRSWNEDPTSNAPSAGRKRRRDDDEDEDHAQMSASVKKAKDVSVVGSAPNGNVDEHGQKAAASSSVLEHADAAREESPRPAGKDNEVKEVTRGVKHVELDDKTGEEDASGDTDVEDGSEDKLAAEVEEDAPEAAEDTKDAKDEALAKSSAPTTDASSENETAAAATTTATAKPIDASSSEAEDVTSPANIPIPASPDLPPVAGSDDASPLDDDGMQKESGIADDEAP